MKALVIEQRGRARLATTKDPEMGPDEVLLCIRTIGFCGSDLNSYRGLNPLVSYPRIPGHEIAATVQQIGPGVPAGILREGMDVTVFPYTSCGSCAACVRGRSNACRSNQTLGVQRDGALTERFSVSWEKVLPSEGLPPRALALVEPLSVGFHAVDRAGVGPDDSVAVIGCGAVGLGAVSGATRRGARVIAVDIEDGKLTTARHAGAAYTVNSHAASLRECLDAITGGHGPDVVVEAAGTPETFVGAIRDAAFAGRVIYIGYVKAPVTYETSEFVKKELDIRGSRNATVEDFRAVMVMLRGNTFPVAQTVNRVVNLEEAGHALETWSEDPASVTRIHVDVA
ncbi:MAG: zinc-binding alcohol dehydrogenase family protein [Gemmatimonadaceae bacterium]